MFLLYLAALIMIVVILWFFNKIVCFYYRFNTTLCMSSYHCGMLVIIMIIKGLDDTFNDVNIVYSNILKFMWWYSLVTKVAKLEWFMNLKLRNNRFLCYSITHYLWMLATYLIIWCRSIMELTSYKMFKNLLKGKQIILRITNMR